MLQATRSVKGTKPLRVLRSCCAHSAFSPLVSKGGATHTLSKGSGHEFRPQAKATSNKHLPAPAPGGCLPRSLRTAEAASSPPRKKRSAVGNSWKEEGQSANIRVWETRLWPNKVHFCFPRKQSLAEPPQRTGQGTGTQTRALDF